MADFSEEYNKWLDNPDHKKWYNKGREEGFVFMLEVYDDYSGNTYPVYFTKDDNLKYEFVRHNTGNQCVVSIVRLREFEFFLETAEDFKRRFNIK